MKNIQCKTIYHIRRRENQPMVREKFFEMGIKKITNHELLMLILGSGVKGCPIEQLAEEVLDVLEFRNSEDLFSHLCTIKGMGKSKASTICACMELGKRLCSQSKKCIKEPADVIPMVRHYALENVEYFICITLNAAGEIITLREISKGASNSAQIQPREVFTQVLKDQGAAVIFVHNHPSGNVTPSREDLELTGRLVKGGKILGIPTLDHIIISLNDYFSFAGNNLIKKFEKNLF
ncbi:MAG: RadC family protein [Treponemataceae bacterium]